MKKLIILLLIILSFAGCNKSSEPIKVTILQLNDVYEISSIGNAGGMARVAALQKTLSKESDHILTVMAGDFLSPTVIGNLEDELGKVKGRQMVEVMNAVPFDLVTFGNHEFDLPYEDLQKRIDESTFDWISANVSHKQADGTVIPFQKNNSPIPAYKIYEFHNKQGDAFKVGIFGVTTNQNKANYVHYHQNWEQTAIETYHMLASKTDAVIGLTHLDLKEDMQLAQKGLGKLRLIMGGHEHEHQEKEIKNTLIRKADANAKSAYIHRITFFPNADEQDRLRIKSELVEITAENFPEVEPNVASLVNKWEHKKNKLLKAQGYDLNQLVLELDSGQVLEGRDKYMRSQQTNLGHLITEAMLWVSRQNGIKAQAALLNSGSVRLDDKLQGKITQYDIIRTLLFDGRVVYTTVHGNDLKKILNDGLLNLKGDGMYLQLANIDEHKHEDKWYFDSGQPVEAKKYQIVALEYLIQNLNTKMKENKLKLSAPLEYYPVSFRFQEENTSELKKCVMKFMLENSQQAKAIVAHETLEFSL
jgi:5'-nucleotidase / UDP-sugar diphosphatase